MAVVGLDVGFAGVGVLWDVFICLSVFRSVICVVVFLCLKCWKEFGGKADPACDPARDGVTSAAAQRLQAGGGGLHSFNIWIYLRSYPHPAFS